MSLVSRAAIGAALVGGQMSDRMHAGKILADSDPTQGAWSKRIDGTVAALASVNAVIDKARKHQASRGKAAMPLEGDE